MRVFDEYTNILKCMFLVLDSTGVQPGQGETQSTSLVDTPPLILTLDTSHPHKCRKRKHDSKVVRDN